MRSPKINIGKSVCPAHAPGRLMKARPMRFMAIGNRPFAGETGFPCKTLQTLEGETAAIFRSSIMKNRHLAPSIMILVVQNLWLDSL